MKISTKAWLWIGVSGLILVVLAAVLGWAVFPYVVHLFIGQKLALKQGTDAWDRFVELPLALDMRMSIFNVTNIEEIKQGAKPKLKELGPFAYKQHRKKYDVTINQDDDTVSYHQNLIHIYDQEASGEFKADDKVTVINPALMSLLNIMQNIPVLSKGTLFVDAAAKILFPEGLFVTTTADELIFRGVRIKCGSIEREAAVSGGGQGLPNLAKEPGFQPTPRLAALITCSSLKRIKVPSLTVLEDGDVLFSIFGYKNNTYDGMYTVHSGITHPEKLAQITAWEGKHFVKAWGGPTCNAVNGTQGDIFTPGVNKKTMLSVFSTDICRSMTLQYVEDTSYRGISGYRFAPGWEMMASAQEYGPNYCFCPQVAKGLTKENGCLRKGAMDLSGCQGMPVIVTYPHFYEADPFYLDAVEGLNPQQELHRMQLDIEPMTGVPLLGGKKMQINFELKAVPGVELTRGVRDTLFPVAWMYEGAQLDTNLLNLLNSLLFNNLIILDAVKYTMLALGALMFLSGSGMYVRARRRGLTTVRPDLSESPDQRPNAHASGGGDVGLVVPQSSATALSTTADIKLQTAGSNGNASGV